ncbi:hypothetical protein [Actinomadura sp. 9N407]|uniref:hypothetical protein n=1 Tax=Actinomadura sp. 9N407 TaxID=3375154 RepID=UPI0037B93E95
MTNSTPGQGQASDGGCQDAPLAGHGVFQEWLEAMHPRLAGLADFLLPRDFPFDYSRGSLARLEEILLDTFAERRSVYAVNHRDFLDRCARYIGETLIRNFGGEWRYHTDRDAIFAGVPHLVNDDGTDVPVAPLYLVASLASRRTGHELTSVFDGTAQQYVSHHGKQRVPATAAASPGQLNEPKLNDAEALFLER